MVEEHLNKRKGRFCNYHQYGFGGIEIHLQFCQEEGMDRQRTRVTLSVKRPENQAQRYVPPLEDFKKVLDKAKPLDKAVAFGRISDRWKDF